MPLRLVVTDLDGTFLDPAGQIPPANIEAVRKLAERGIPFVIASGRMTVAIRPTYKLLGVDGPVISYNGAMVRDLEARGGGVVYHQPLPASVADRVLDLAAARGEHLNYYLEDVLYVKEDPRHRRWVEHYGAQTGSPTTCVSDLGQFRGQSPTKIILITDEPERDRLYHELLPKWGSDVYLERTNPEYLEFLHPAVNKGAALGHLCPGHLGIDIKDVLALGDGRNDISLVSAAGMGIAVANARDEVKAAATEVSRLTAGEGAVAEAVARWVLA